MVGFERTISKGLKTTHTMRTTVLVPASTCCVTYFFSNVICVSLQLLTESKHLEMSQVRFSRNLIILYGSETGTAQEVAENIWRESKCYHFKGGVISMNEYDISNLINERFVLFVCSTTGVGGKSKLAILIAMG